MRERRVESRPTGRRAPLAILVGVGLALAIVAPTIAAPASGLGAVHPTAAGSRHDTAKMIYDLEMDPVHYNWGTIRLDSYWNASGQWTRETMRFNMRGLKSSTLYHAYVFQGKCYGDSNPGPYVASISARTNAAGQLTQTRTLTSAQRAIMRGLYAQRKPISIEMDYADSEVYEPHVCGVLWQGT